MNEISSFEDILDRFGQLVYPPKGVSMLPLLREERDLMIVQRKSGKSLQKHDVVLFKRPVKNAPDAYVLHRIEKLNPDGSYWIVGDNSFCGDTVQEKQIIGVLSAVIRDGKTIPVTKLSYRIYVKLWYFFYPLRYLLRRAHNLIRRLQRSGLRT